MTKTFKFILIIVLTVFMVYDASSQTNNPFVSASGKWVKLEFDRTGVYKIDYNKLKDWGFNPSNINPQLIRCFSVQGDGIPIVNDSTDSWSLIEAPIKIVGGQDGVIDPQDYILVYRKISRGWKVQNGNFKHFINPLSNKSYAIFGYSDPTDTKTQNLGKRLISQDKTTGSAIQTIGQGLNLQFHDSDRVNPMKMSSNWFGERLGNEYLTKQYTFPLSHNPDSAWVNLRLAPSITSGTGSVIIKINQFRDTIKLRAVYSSDENYYTFTRNYGIKSPGNQLKVEIEFIRPNNQSSLYVDYIEVHSPENLNLNSSSKEFYISQLMGTQNSVNVNIASNFKPEIWNVSNSYNPIEIMGAYNSNSTNCIFQDKEIGHTLFAFDPSQCPTPQKISDVKTKDYHLIEAGKPLYLSADKFKSTIKQRISQIQEFNGLYKGQLSDQENVFASFPNAKSKIPFVQVAFLNDVYEVFSGGQPDLMAIRNFSRELTSPLTLIGTTSYDFKDRIANNTNYIPIYQSANEQLTSAFCLDDFFGYHEVGQGDPYGTKNKLSQPIGRIPVRTDAELNSYLNKLIRYNHPNALGSWRNQLSFVADDIDEPWEAEFTRESESYAQYITGNYSFLKVNRLYADAFKQVTNGNNEAYPDLSKSISDAFQKGSLFINYQGHGGEKGWGQEAFFDIPTINGLNNRFNMPVLFTATCEFSRYDNPEFQSAGELTLLNPNGGAIALMTTTRSVWVSGNSLINEAFWTKYGFPKENEEVPTTGVLYQRLKNRPFLTSEDNKFAFLGDVFQKPAFPEHLIQVDSVNQIATASFNDTLKAFSVVEIKGSIRKRGLPTHLNLYSTFDGLLDVEIYDKPIKKSTLNNDGSNANVPFSVENSVIFKGQVTVSKGQFMLKFAVPKDISYSLGEGRALFYAKNEYTDATGSWSFVIGGSEIVAEVDTVGPTVKAFMNDTFFVSGENVLTDAQFIALVNDPSGINSTGAGIGRDMLVILDPGSENEKSYIVNEYFQYLPNSYKTGLINFPLRGLSPGKHTISVKVWDIFNNSGTDKVDFEVVPGRQLIISGEQCSPNPVNDGQDISLSFRHNLAGEDLKVKVNIYDLLGQLIYNQEDTEYLSSTEVKINIKSSGYFGGWQHKSGCYVYQISVQTSDGLLETVSGKIILQ
ncbi:MAG: type IX secretion system sortase PorU [Bacteroidia bacterium]|nr:type IX secretion system sortase PorU [Bacteroidia bacterium]